MVKPYPKAVGCGVGIAAHLSMNTDRCQAGGAADGSDFRAGRPGARAVGAAAGETKPRSLGITPSSGRQLTVQLTPNSGWW